MTRRIGVTARAVIQTGARFAAEVLRPRPLRRRCRHATGRWMPIALRWRRQRAQTPAASQTLLHAVNRHEWSPHVHLRVHPHSVEGGTTRTILSRAEVVRRTPSGVRQSTSGLGGLPRLSQRLHPRVGRRRPAFAAAPEARPASQARPVISGRPSRSSQYTPALHSPAALHRWIERRRLVERRSVVTMCAARVTRHRPDRGSDPIPRGVAERMSVPRVQRDSNPKPRPMMRPAELSWRSSDRTKESPPPGLTVIGRTAAHANPSSPTAVTPQLATPAAAAHPTTTPRTFASLDPGLVDRLADDVIRRVERRARVERDRRGI